MRPSYLFALGGAGVLGFALLLALLAHGNGFPLLAPSGSVGVGERDLMVRTVYLMLIVVVPVVILAIFIAWHYREGNTTASYTPNWEHSKMEEFIWWSIPFEIVLVLSAVMWSGTHELDPAKALASAEPPLTVQVVALPWKWLFIYPEQGVASVNELALPVNRPVEFLITADAPMNSFWIPALGGQMYAMTGMTTVLHLLASVPGNFTGRSANYSGAGFAQMMFMARAMSQSDFDAWVATAKQAEPLSSEAYSALRAPSDAGPVRYYGTVSMTFADILNLYMPLHTGMPMPMDMNMDMPMGASAMHHH
jgi:cytochrome o ubiquinol oxidase subunit 2